MVPLRRSDVIHRCFVERDGRSAKFNADEDENAAESSEFRNERSVWFLIELYCGTNSPVVQFNLMTDFDPSKPCAFLYLFIFCIC